MWFRLRLRGRPVHVSESERGTNAILSAFGLIEALRGHTRELNERAKAHPWFSRIPNPIKFNPGKIAGGDWASSTPAWCEVDCRIAVLPGMPLADFREELSGVVMAAARQDPFLADNPPEVIWNGFQADDYVLEPGSDFEAAVRAAHVRVHGSEPGETILPAVTDCRFYGGKASSASNRTASASGITCCCWTPRRRTDTVFSSASRLPTTSMTGTLASECSRTL